MRVATLLMLLLAAAASGCLEDGDEGLGDGGSGDGPESDEAAPVASNGSYAVTPDSWSEIVPASISESPVPLPTGFCDNLTNYCYSYTFTVTANGDVAGVAQPTANLLLTWSIDQNDFDMELLDAAGRPLAGDFGIPPETSITLEAPVEAGTYTIDVYAYQVVADTFQLDLTFE